MTHFEEIYAKHSSQIYRVCMGYFNDPDQAKDVTQDTFIAVWKNLASFRNQSQISTWIFRIATNNCLRALEKSKRVTMVELPFDLTVKQEDTQDEKLAFLYQCINQLEETERIIISLVLEDLPQADIASVVGITTGNLRVKIHRIKEKLATKFKADGQFK